MGTAVCIELPVGGASGLGIGIFCHDVGTSGRFGGGVMPGLLVRSSSDLAASSGTGGSPSRRGGLFGHGLGGSFGRTSEVFGGVGGDGGIKIGCVGICVFGIGGPSSGGESGGEGGCCAVGIPGGGVAID